MRVSIDEDLCVGTGQCELICPDVFRVDLVARLITETPDPRLHEAVRAAADSCPTEAIGIGPVQG